MTIEAVVFDIGNVLINWQPERYYDRVLGEARRKELFAAVNLLAMNEEIDRGSDFRDTVYACAEAHPQYRNEIRMWHDNWLDLAQPRIAGSVEILRDLQAAGVPVFALTNFGVGTFELARSAYEFLDEFDRCYVSGELRLMKPDAAIYAKVEEDSGIAPERLLFTDDRPENIQAAEARGWKGHLFETPEGWASCLRAHGFPVTAAS